MKQPYNTALYMRLSQDDKNFGDSVSIETQRTILRTYARDNGLHVVDEYVDDGWSGTNFDRPAFQRMMEDVDSGKINCIVTKDLSRFGREHIMVDYYLEFEFPQRHVRYIAVAENEDTEKGLTDFVPFKNLFNEWYAKDTSRKIKAALHAKFAAGEHTCTYAPFGYRKDPDIRNHLLIDEETRWIVEKIFEMARHGAGPMKIAKTLCGEHIPTPGWFHYVRGEGFNNIYDGAPEDKAWEWQITHVKNILCDEVYIGNSVHGRQTSISYKNKKSVRKPEELWFRVENTHEPIISKDIFAQVQEQIKHRKRTTKREGTQIFSGLVRCADCGWSMTFATNTSGRKPWRYFNCSYYRQLGKVGGKCSSHYIRYEILYEYVRSQLRRWSRFAQTDEKGLLEYLLQSGDREKAATMKKKAAELSKAEKRRDEVDKLFARLYEDRVTGSISEQNYAMLSQKYQSEQAELSDRIETLKADLSAVKQTEADAEKWIALIKQYSDPDQLDATILNTLIEKIVVHEAEKDETGTRTQDVDIFYRFVGKIA